MEDKDFVSLWKSYDKKINEQVTLNRKNTEEITKIKARSLLLTMKPLKYFTILTGILWVIFVDILIINLFDAGSVFFLISAAIHVLLTKLAIGIYIYQLVLIYQVDINETIVNVQVKLAKLKASTLWVTRLLFLQLPVWTTFYWSKAMFTPDNYGWLSIHVLVTLSFVYMAVWIFVNITPENINKKWFRLIFSGQEWDPIIKSIDLLKQLDEFQAAS